MTIAAMVSPTWYRPRSPHLLHVPSAWVWALGLRRNRWTLRIVVVLMDSCREESLYLPAPVFLGARTLRVSAGAPGECAVRARCRV